MELEQLTVQPGNFDRICNTGDGKYLEIDTGFYIHWWGSLYYAEKDNTLDVLFMGNSDMYRGMSPIVLWDEYGIASYSYTSPGQRMWTSYYVLLDALRSQSPEIIVLNVDSIQSTGPSAESNYRKALDNMQMSPVKIKAILDPAFKFNIEKKISFVFPILRYHTRAADLTKEDFELAYGYNVFEYKGMDMNANVRPYEGGNTYMEEKEESFEIPEEPKKYVDKIIEICEENNIKLILVEIPSADSWSYAKSIALSEYALEKEVPFIDFNLLLDEIDLDWTKDTEDGGDHLNVIGAEKVSKYMGEYLKQNYDIKDRREDENYKSWFESSNIYHKDKQEKINKVQNSK